MPDIPGLKLIGKFCFKQLFTMQVKEPWLCADFSGLQFLRTYNPDGSLQGEYSEKDLPFLYFAAPNDKEHFCYDEHRENWVLMLEPDLFVRDPETNGIFFRSDGNLLPVKRFLKLKPEEIPILRRNFERIYALHMSGTPPDRAAAEFLTAAFLARFLADAPEKSAGLPAEQFRASLDADTTWQYSIEEHSRKCGYSRDRMRGLFQKRFGITPNEYRTRKRLDFLLHEIIYTNLSLKEIADQAGLRHVQHLYAIFKENGIETPGILCQRYREKK